jgi:hypothetical protein
MNKLMSVVVRKLEYAESALKVTLYGSQVCKIKEELHAIRVEQIPIKLSEFADVFQHSSELDWKYNPEAYDAI